VATVATATMLSLGSGWRAIIRSAVMSGIVGDLAHQTAPGRHLSWEDNLRLFGSGSWPLNWTAGDKSPKNKRAASAIDMSMNVGDMIAVTKRFVKVFENRKTDRRAKYVNAVNGTTDGVNAKRWDFVSGAISWTDNSHLWHVHDETMYDKVDDPEMVRAHLSIVKGESAEQYLGASVRREMELSDKVGDKQFPNRTVQNFFVDFFELRRYVEEPVGSPGKPWVPQQGSPFRALERIYNIEQAVATLTANVAALAGKDFIDEDQLADMVSGKVLAALPGNTDEELVGLLKGLFGEDRLVKLLARASTSQA
jgi:hypothetical protein